MPSETQAKNTNLRADISAYLKGAFAQKKIDDTLDGNHGQLDRLFDGADIESASYGDANFITPEIKKINDDLLKINPAEFTHEVFEEYLTKVARVAMPLLFDENGKVHPELINAINSSDKGTYERLLAIKDFYKHFLWSYIFRWLPTKEYIKKYNLAAEVNVKEHQRIIVIFEKTNSEFLKNLSPLPPIHWEHVVEQSIFVNNGDFKNIPYKQRQVIDSPATNGADVARDGSQAEQVTTIMPAKGQSTILEPVVRDLARCKQLTIITPAEGQNKEKNIYNNTEEKEAVIKAGIVENGLKLDKNIQSFLLDFLHQDGFYSIGRLTIQYDPGIIKNGGIIPVNFQAENLLEVNKDGSIDLGLDASIYSYLKATDPENCIQAKEQDNKILTVNSRFNISYTKAEGLTFRVKKFQVRAYDDAANNLYPNKKLESVTSLGFAYNIISFITKRVAAKTTKQRNSELIKFIKPYILDKDILCDNPVVFKQTDQFFKLLKAHERYAVMDPVKGRRSSTQEYLSELRTIRTEYKPGVFENLLGKLKINQTQRYLFSQSLKNTINSIEQKWRDVKKKKVANLEKTKIEPAADQQTDEVIQKYGNAALKAGFFEKAKEAYQILKNRLNIANDRTVKDELSNVEKQYAELMEKLKGAREEVRPIDDSLLLEEIKKLNMLIKVTQGVTITKEMQAVLKEDQYMKAFFKEIKKKVNDRKYLQSMSEIFLETKNKLENSLKKYEDVTYDQDIEKQLAELRNRYNELLKVTKADKAVAPTNHRYFMLNYAKANAAHKHEKEPFDSSGKEEPAAAPSASIKKSMH